SIYGTYSEGFGMPDVGRVLRGVAEFDTDVDTLPNLVPLVTDNTEFGVEYTPDWGSMKVAWYQSSSDFGERLVTNADGIFDVNRDKTVVTGIEASIAGRPTDWLDISVVYSNLKGEFDSDGDGHVDSDLGAINVAPNRLNLSFDVNPDGKWSGRLQSFTYLDKTFRDANNAVTAQFDGYTVIDALAMTTVGSTRLTFGVANILDKQYITYYGQAGNTRADRYFAGKGRTLTVRADFRF
ncbi:MAG: TonB-dependent receptor, partial [Woeseiaceae bacterium]